MFFVSKKPDASPVSIRFRLSLAEVLYNACIASDSYRTVFLQSLGVSVGRIGIISSLSTIANIVAPPIWGAISDKIRSPRICFVLCLGLSALLMAAAPAAGAGGRRAVCGPGRGPDCPEKETARGCVSGPRRAAAKINSCICVQEFFHPENQHFSAQPALN